jgi:hypothetical protein
MQTMHKLMLALFASLIIATAAILLDLAWLNGQSGIAYFSNSSSSFNATYTNATITKAEGYVNLINQSSYIIFRPNLTAAYHYLNLSIEAYNKSDGTLSIRYASLAQQSAESAYSQISAYKYDSAAAMVAFTLFIGVILYIHMKPIRKPGRKEKAKS